MNAAVLSIRLLALLAQISEHSGQEEVHRLRTTVRRLEVHLGKCPATILKALQQLRKKAGKVRDIDVHLALLKPALFLRTPAERNAASGLRTNLQQEPRKKPTQEKLRQTLGKELREILKAKRDRHLGLLREVVIEATPLLQAKLPMMAERATRSADAAADNVYQHISRARKSFLQWTLRVPEDDERLHRLRICTKKLRYSLEPMQEYPEAAELAAQLKRVQDAIGSWHDWATLEQLAERKLTSPDAAASCAMLRARTASECRKAHRAAASVRSWMLGGEPAAPAAADDESKRLIHKVG